MVSYRVMIDWRGHRICAGVVSPSTSYRTGQLVKGWRFFPHTQANPSRNVWPTPEAALKGRVRNYTLEEVKRAQTAADHPA